MADVVDAGGGGGGGGGGGSDGGSSPSADAGTPGNPRACNPSAKFTDVAPVLGVAMTGFSEVSPRLSRDELTLFFSATADGSSDSDIYSTHRNSIGDPFDAPLPVMALNTTLPDFDPSVSSDGATIWFSSKRVTGQQEHLYIATRVPGAATFGEPAPATLNAANTALRDLQPFVTADDKEVWFATSRDTGALDIWRAVRRGNEFDPPVPVTELNEAGFDMLPTLSSDRLTVYFTSSRGGNFDIWTARRAVVTDPFSTLEPVTELNTTGIDQPGWLSADNCRLYGSSGAGDAQLFIATRQP